MDMNWQTGDSSPAFMLASQAAAYMNVPMNIGMILRPGRLTVTSSSTGWSTNFHIRVIKYCKDALSPQVGEAVRISYRG